ncbi:MAG TPA: RNA-directed DNA polymerase [Pseudomonas aeruginosa]|uniref:reverse transcriptase family protein n=1 Tax=Pseudomonas aeruginosa TaxID=287 RepID=UPI000EAEDF8B|nr:reverse transcriptase family protein [Pseudomonas aeruginosa]HCT6673937.1 RNA-directed DNA polymerase [Pseudomonas aeruginosa]HHV91582.1 RNA-directed DNA polymerase [Pseudomonas aeruginosa]
MKDWKPQHYRRASGASKVSVPVLAAAIATSEKTVAVHPSLPPILTLKHLAHLTGVPYKHLRDYVSRDTEAYKIFRVRKRARPGTPTSFRVICVPPPSLAIAQKWIAQHVLAKAKPHSASTAFAPSCRLVDAAKPHCASRWLIKVDVQRFFESISEIDCYRVFRSLGYQPLVSLELSRLCTRVGRFNGMRHGIKWRRKASIKKSKIMRYALLRLGHLPQGAATSPMLANLVMRDADELLTSMADQLGMTYTRYADDLTFSTASPVFERQTARRVINEIYQVLRRYGLTPNLAKTTIVPPRSRKIVLGLQVDQDEPRLTRAFKMKMRMHLHYLEREDVGPLKHAERRGFSAVAGMRNHLMGLAAYASQIEPTYGRDLKDRLEKLDWPLLY